MKQNQIVYFINDDKIDWGTLAHINEFNEYFVDIYSLKNYKEIKEIKSYVDKHQDYVSTYLTYTQKNIGNPNLESIINDFLSNNIFNPYRERKFDRGTTRDTYYKLNQVYTIFDEAKIDLEKSLKERQRITDMDDIEYSFYDMEIVIRPYSDNVKDKVREFCKINGTQPFDLIKKKDGIYFKYNFENQKIKNQNEIFISEYEKSNPKPKPDFRYHISIIEMNDFKDNIFVNEWSNDNLQDILDRYINLDPYRYRIKIVDAKNDKFNYVMYILSIDHTYIEHYNLNKGYYCLCNSELRTFNISINPNLSIDSFHGVHRISGKKDIDREYIYKKLIDIVDKDIADKMCDIAF